MGRGTSTTRSEGGISDEAVRKATGKGWDEWFFMLDRAGAKDRSHKDIAGWIDQRPDSPGGWWSQMITVAYEQASGLRQKHEKTDGFSVSVSRTLGVGAEKVYTAFVDARVHAKWLGDEKLTITTSTPGKSVRIRRDGDGTRVDVNLYSKGAGKCQVALQHNKLSDAAAVEKQREFWKGRLRELTRLISTQNSGDAKPSKDIRKCASITRRKR